MNTQDYINIENEFGATNYKPLDVVLTKGLGVWVWDVEGKKYMDCLSAYSAVNQGHCHPKIAAVMIEQAQKLTLTSRAFRNDQLGLFYKELCELTHSHMVLPMNSGAEAAGQCGVHQSHHAPPEPRSRLTCADHSRRSQHRIHHGEHRRRADLVEVSGAHK